MNDATSFNEDPFREVSLIEHMRKRPAMYLGSTLLQGLASYICSPVSLLTSAGATFIHITISDKEYLYESDAQLELELDQKGFVRHFESHQSMMRLSPGNLLCAFSETLEIQSITQNAQYRLRMESGIRKQFDQSKSANQQVGTSIRFRADGEIFASTLASPYMLEQFFERISCRFPGVQFRITGNGETKEFCSADRFGDLFRALSASTIVLHEPVRIHASRHGVQVDLIYVLHGSKKSHSHLLLKNDDGRKKGTPLKGLKKAIRKIREDLEICKDIGVFALLQIDPPDVFFRGQNRIRIANPELSKIVEHVAIAGTDKWIDERPGIREQLKSLTPVPSMLWSN